MQWEARIIAYIRHGTLEVAKTWKVYINVNFY